MAMKVQIAYDEEAYITFSQFDGREYTVTEDIWDDSDEWFIAEIHSKGMQDTIRKKHPTVIIDGE